jgi:hypothetical protein
MTVPQPCPYCGRTDCPDRDEHDKYAARVAQQDKARLVHYGLKPAKRK